jgi:hypothetical protein
MDNVQNNSHINRNALKIIQWDTDRGERAVLPVEPQHDAAVLYIVTVWLHMSRI